MEAAVSQTGAWPLVRLTRPRQWIKNLLVFAPLLFSASFLKPESDVKAFIGFVAFCVASSASYVLNDLMDVASDRLHPLKSVTRPIAAGLVSPFAAWVLFGVLVALTLCTFAFDTMTAIALILYLLLNVAYSARLKHVPVLDLFILSGGFVLRVYVGIDRDSRVPLVLDVHHDALSGVVSGRGEAAAGVGASGSRVAFGAGAVYGRAARLLRAH
jgi:4-hydroxybenzoate polyprenyltransferase